MSRRGNESFHLLGAPLQREHKNEFETALIDRFKSGTSNQVSEGLVSYIERVTDRQINKARGLLTFNSIILASLTILISNSGTMTTSSQIGIILSLISSILSLLLLYVIWAPSKYYRSPVEDFKRACKVCYLRAYVLTVSIGTSSVATISLVTSIF